MATRVIINAIKADDVSRRAALRIVRKALREVQAEARTMALGGPYATGKLSRSIKIDRPQLVGKMITGSVYTNRYYAPWVHEGARPHFIPQPPDRGPPMLKFYWRKVRHVVYFHHVNHPGQRGKQYLTIPLAAAARRNNLRIIHL